MRDARATETARDEKVREPPMRLTCPGCGAQYEIAPAAIPAAGREVECSACNHVWRQSRSDDGAAPYDPAARPALNRPLNESILSILREETARELQARKSPAEPPASAADQVSATAGPEDRKTAPASAATAVPAPPPSAPAPAPAKPPAPAASPAPAPIGADWPATTLTDAAKPARSAKDTPAAPPEPEAEEEPESAPQTAEAQDETQDKAPDEEPDEAPQEPQAIAPALPDAAALAATLTRSGPAPAGQKAQPEPEAAEEAAESDSAEPPKAEPPKPASDTAPTAAPPTAPTPEAAAAASRRSGYAAGFGLAAMLALGVVAVYALAPRVSADGAGALLVEWRQDLDRGRLWLHDRIIGPPSSEE